MRWPPGRCVGRHTAVLNFENVNSQPFCCRTVVPCSTSEGSSRSPTTEIREVEESKQNWLFKLSPACARANGSSHEASRPPTLSSPAAAGTRTHARTRGRAASRVWTRPFELSAWPRQPAVNQCHLRTQQRPPAPPGSQARPPPSEQRPGDLCTQGRPTSSAGAARSAASREGKERGGARAQNNARRDGRRGSGGAGRSTRGTPPSAPDPLPQSTPPTLDCALCASIPRIARLTRPAPPPRLLLVLAAAAGAAAAAAALWLRPSRALPCARRRMARKKRALRWWARPTSSAPTRARTASRCAASTTSSSGAATRQTPRGALPPASAWTSSPTGAFARADQAPAPAHGAREERRGGRGGRTQPARRGAAAYVRAYVRLRLFFAPLLLQPRCAVCAGMWPRCATLGGGRGTRCKPHRASAQRPAGWVGGWGRHGARVHL